MERHPANPIITVDDCPGVMQVYNPSPVLFDDKVYMLVSVTPYRNYKFGKYGETRLAISENGIDFKIEDEPFINLQHDTFPFNIVRNHVIDSRITKIDDVFYILTPVGCISPFSDVCGVLGKTHDFKEYEVVDIITLPPNRGASLFPEKINGKYFKLDRPGAGNGNTGSIWLSSSPDLIHWGQYRPLMGPGTVRWGEKKIGPTPPVKTEHGWLVVTHGVFTPCSGPVYSIGAILLDHNDPTKIKGITYTPLMKPETDYEKRGWVDNAIFPCGTIVYPEKNELWLYYGAADSSVCLAIGAISEIVAACLNEA